MNRRNLILAGTGITAAAAGLAWQLRNGAGHGAMTAMAASADPAAGLDAGAQAFWQSSFTQPDGQPLALAGFRGQPLLLNFWATWCPPCVKEMPEIDRYARELAAKGGRVIGLAVDNPSAVREFLKKKPVSYAIGLAGFDGTDLSRKLGNSSGALPFTALFGRNGAVMKRKLGETSLTELQSWSQAL
jgi:thiol-disulfide isomerase/thioredoxin